MKIVGIDFGSKLAGTTVVCYHKVGKNDVQLFYCRKNEDADEFILEHVSKLKPDVVMIDAPLSLPGKYKDPEGYGNYFYRQCDLECKAMSPMFLGGLTARAIQLKDQIYKRGVLTLETYPAQQANNLNLDPLNYKKQSLEIPSMILQINKLYGLNIDSEIVSNWHSFDAVLAMIAGLHLYLGKAVKIGNEEEGVIYL
jgi:uncharacterized protein